MAIAVLRDKLLMELHRERTEKGFAVGDIYLAKVRKVAPGLNAAFVDVGHEKDAFLHYYDLGPQYRNSFKFTKAAVQGNQKGSLLEDWKLDPDISKEGKLGDVVSASQSVLVQIAKEPISTKGPRLTAEITIAGRYMVLVPFINKVSISSRITDETERKRLKELMHAIRPKNFGMIVRTNAEGKKSEDLEADLKNLMQRWDVMFHNLRNAMPPKRVLGEIDRTSAVLRDVLNKDFTNIHVNDPVVYEEVKETLARIAPEKLNIVKHYTGKLDIFDNFFVNKQIKQAFGKQVMLPSGAYLVIEKTEAMHVIDVNSGHKIVSNDVEQTIFGVNLEAAEEIARQIRLRDIGGLIVIDFIDMKNLEHRKQLAKAMEDFMRKDRAQHTILPLSKFGLMQITRERARPEVMMDTAEMCPSCGGSGKVNATILLTDDIERDLEYIMQSRPKSLRLSVHPYLEAYLRKGFPNRQMRWWMKHSKWVRIEADANCPLMAYRFFDSNDDEIRMN